MSTDNRERGADDAPNDGPRAPQISLGTARIIALLMYLSVPVYAVVGEVAKLQRVSHAPSIVAWALFAVAIADYLLSLLFEAKLLSGQWTRQSAPASPPRPSRSTPVAAAIIVSTFGVSIAIDGLVLRFLSFSTWPWYLYGLSILHGIHLQLRWDRYEEADRRARTHLD
jgi:hypothetical protein